jgi:hypothetical protein
MPSGYQVTITVGVVRVSSPDTDVDGLATMYLSCGHTTFVNREDEEAFSLLGALTGCSSHTTWEGNA